jgi:FAD/FMN-containing dehydrogenase
VDKIHEFFSGDINEDVLTRKNFSHDASMFEMVPDVVVAPKNVSDIEKLVKFVSENKHQYRRTFTHCEVCGHCMSGGAVNDSIIIDITKYFNKIGEVTSKQANVQPGVYYRDFEVETLKHGALMRAILRQKRYLYRRGHGWQQCWRRRNPEFGKVEKFIKQLKVVFADGNEYIVKPLTRVQLIKKMAQDDFEGRIYKEIFELIEKNYDEIKAAKPGVSKDSTGYHLWDVWDRETGIFDLTQLIVGSQGVLGIITDITFKLVPKRKHSGTLVIFLKTLDDLGEMIVDVMRHKPATFEGFDSYTLALSVRLFFGFRKTRGWGQTINLAFRLFKSAFKIVESMPKMVLLVEFDGDDQDDVARRVHALRQDLVKYKHEAVFEEDETEMKAKKFWIMRHESFNLIEI